MFVFLHISVPMDISNSKVRREKTFDQMWRFFNSRKHIITAGHCLEGQKKESLTVVLGATDAILEEGEEFDVKDYEIHPKYEAPKAQNIY